MKTKRILAFFLILMMLIPGQLWAESNDKETAGLISIIKKKISVPKELKEFRYDMRNEDKQNIYVFTWSDKEYKVGEVQVTSEADGNIINYSKNMYGTKYSILAKVSYEEGLKAAKNFLTKIKAPYINELKLKEEEGRTQGNQFVYAFDQYVNGIKVQGSRVLLFVDKQSGEVTNFQGLKTYKGAYKDSQPKLSLEQAKETYLNKIGITLAYNIRYDYEKRTISSFPLYVINNGEGKAIDAKTGEIIVPIRKEFVFYGKGEMPQADTTGAKNAADGGLTPEEQKVVEEIKGLLTKEQAKAAAEKYFERIKGAAITNAYLTKSEFENKYIWTLSMQKTDVSNNTVLANEQTKTMAAAGESLILPPHPVQDINVSIDAKTGEVLSYYYYSGASEKETKVSDQDVKQKVEAFLKKVAKDKFAMTKYSEEDGIMRPMPLTETSSYKNYYYIRLVKGIPVNGNGLRVTYDSVNNEVISYTQTWNEVAFKDVKRVVDKEKIADQIGLELMYVNKDEGNRVAAYTHEERHMTFDPFMGIKVNSYDGKPIVSSEQGLYDDIKGHAKETVIKKLYDSGIFLPGQSFKPDSQINQLDFLRFVLRITDQNITEEEIYKMAVNNGILEEREKSKNKLVSKQQGVAYLINNTPYKDIAKLTEIYKYPFKDENKADKDLRGYITLAYGLKLIEADKNNAFNPKDKLTRAEAAQMIYNMLVHENK